jgi:membrane associated rhomboid family serine protease
MGIADRDYYRNDPRDAGRRVGSMSAWTVNTWIIVINVSVFILNALTGPHPGGFVRSALGIVPVPPYLGAIGEAGYFSFAKAFQELQLWRIVTFQFLHDPFSITHVAFNMFGLYMFGPMIENMLGRRRYLAFYLLCGVAGPLMYLLIMSSGLLTMDVHTPLIGASAGVYGVLIAAARMAPSAWVQLLFPPIPMQLRTLAWIMIGMAVLVVFTRGSNAGGEAAHLGGAAMGFWLISNPNVLNVAEKLVKRKPRMRIAQ